LQKRAYRFDPYRGLWGSFYQSTYVNVDSAGWRRTVQPEPSSNARRVFLLGGSTMWGYAARDAYTIPSLLAAELRRRGIRDVEIVNLAQTAYNATQAVITLLLELRRGNVPSVVVSLDGHNDIIAASRFGEAGYLIWEPEQAAWHDAGRGVKDSCFVWATIHGWCRGSAGPSPKDSGTAARLPRRYPLTACAGTWPFSIAT
jgi:hypothetical protein